MSVPVAWVVGLMTALEPNAPWRPTFERTAEAIAKIAESEPLFEDRSEERTAALLVSVAWYESRLKPTAKSGNGRWYCLYQIDRRHLPNPQQALDEPEVCTRAAIKILRQSLERCATHPSPERLAQFVSGTCEKGLAESRYRMYLTNKLLKDHPAPTKSATAAAGSTN